MIYDFACSGRSVNINKPSVFCKLHGDEISELLCEDPNYISWLTEKNIEKMEAFDISTVLTVRPELFAHFIDQVKDESFMGEYEWNYLTRFQPQFIKYRQIS